MQTVVYTGVIMSLLFCRLEVAAGQLEAVAKWYEDCVGLKVTKRLQDGRYVNT